MTKKLNLFIATFGYVGFVPKAPGSTASLLGVLLYAGLYGRWIPYLCVLILVTVAGFLVSGRVEKDLGQKDPACVVIDEVSGMMITLFLLPLTPSVLITAYFLFRAFDMFKIYPANKLEKLPGSRGIMLDDILAGVYANIVMHIALRWAGIF